MDLNTGTGHLLQCVGGRTVASIPVGNEGNEGSPLLLVSLPQGSTFFHSSIFKLFRMENDHGQNCLSRLAYVGFPVGPIEFSQ